MPEPKGYRKAKRAFELAERLKIPVVTLIVLALTLAFKLKSKIRVALLLKFDVKSTKGAYYHIVIGEGMSGGTGHWYCDRFTL